MNLTEALTEIARAGSLDPAELIACAAEDNIGGRDTGQWRGDSFFADEGRVLYALIRALKPEHVLEIGSAEGCSTTHILTALDKNKRGHLTSIDIDPDAGVKVPAALRKRWTFVNEDALTAELPAADVVFEDGDHHYPFASAILKRITPLNPRVLLSHDALSHLTYGDAFQVYNAWRDVFGKVDTVQIDHAFTGLAYHFNGAA